MAIIGNNSSGFKDKLINYSHSPGYRSVSFDLKVSTSNKDANETTDMQIMLDKDDSFSLLLHLIEVHESAWNYSPPPIDANEGEKMPPIIRKIIESR